MPVRITGIASGNSTIRKRCQPVMPIASDASISFGSMPRIPVTVLRITGSNAYSARAIIAVLAPMPPINGTGISKPNNARLGTVCITLANPSTGVRKLLTRVNKTPSGTPSKIAAPVDTNTRKTCSRVSVSSSVQFKLRKLTNSSMYR